jgi:hypothetical protein
MAGPGVCCSFAVEFPCRRGETRADQGVARAFAVLFLQIQQTVAGTGKSVRSRPEIETDAAAEYPSC